MFGTIPNRFTMSWLNEKKNVIFTQLFHEVKFCGDVFKSLLSLGKNTSLISSLISKVQKFLNQEPNARSITFGRTPFVPRAESTSRYKFNG